MNGILTFGIVMIAHRDSESSLNRNLVLKDGGILMGNEFPLAIHFSRETKRFVTELVDAMVERQFMIVNAGEVFTVQLPAVDELFQRGRKR
jgi:uncharacterized Fe-S cluster-containing radical SAM superfamily protein